MSQFESPEERLLRSGLVAYMSHDMNNMHHWRMAVEEHFRRRSLVGKNVILRYGEKEVHRGMLIGFGTDGQFVILDESDDSVFYGWPMLDVQEIPE